MVWNQAAKGIATGDQAESMYSVLDGRVFGQFCCFDYGNSELDGIDDGNATMEALSWGADTQFGQSGGRQRPMVRCGYRETGCTKVMKMARPRWRATRR